ncbi:MAG: hypothetical protein N2260_07885 [Syntrophobacterales bacterium]|nr:hypothetical protein [Syntrophobacterales bacterium]
MKVLLYCQHVLGIGHFFRSLEIAKALAPHQVLFVEGGQPLPSITLPSHVKRFLLPPLMMDEAFEGFNLEGEELLKVQKERKEKLLKAYEEFSPDVLIIELFPFGRRRFSFELIPLLERAVGDGRKRLIVCSLRDILVEKPNIERYESWVLKHLNGFFDLLLVHSDERIMRLEESFFRVDDILIPIHYTGFVARESARRKVRKDYQRSKKVVVSTGGGKVGSELIEATILAIRDIQSLPLEVEIYMGPFMDEFTKTHLRHIAKGDDRIKFKPFTVNFVKLLSQAEVSISMAGYNTLMDLLTTGIHSILYPFKQNREQRLRAERFAPFGNFVIIDEAKPEVIRRELEAILTRESTPSLDLKESINLQGAETTRSILEEELSRREFSIY